MIEPIPVPGHLLGQFLLVCFCCALMGFFAAVVFILLVGYSVLFYEIKPSYLHSFFKSPLFFPSQMQVLVDI